MNAQQKDTLRDLLSVRNHYTKLLDSPALSDVAKDIIAHDIKGVELKIKILEISAEK